MALVRWSPWQDLFDVRRDMDELLNRFLGPTFAPFTPSLGLTRGMWTPAVDVFHRDGDLVIRAELPGIDPEADVDITLQDGVLYLRGERKRHEQAGGNGTMRVESYSGTFQRAFALPEGVTESDISATYEHGILEIVVQGAVRQPESARIPIQVGTGRKAISAKGNKKS